MNDERGERSHPGLDRLARVTFAVEQPVRRLVRSGRLDPLPHAGTISVLLLAIVVVTGLYITLFFEFGFEASYRSVAGLTDHPIQHLMRSVHRYASAALVLTSVVHGWRTFVAGRFDGPRRWRWLTGWSAVVVVWLAGVTGYWLLWDERAQLLNEATDSVLSAIGLGSIAAGILGSRGTGWPVLLAIWTAHLLTTAVIGWFLWRHLRRSKLPWLPPRLWSGLMLAALVAASVSFPVELLRRADPALLVDTVPLDPFVLFLLPAFGPIPGVVVIGVFVAVAAGVAAVPWILRRDPPVAVVDENACTGCELCVVDCPYHALSIVDGIAVVAADACVGCGICVGSCVFDAVTVAGVEPITPTLHGDVVVVCDRTARLAGDDDASHIVVPCVGVLSPVAIRDLAAGGSVHVVGCAPADCRYGVGNSLAAERLDGIRAPRVSARAARSTSRDFVAPSKLREAMATPGLHPDAARSSVPADRARVAVAAGVVVASVVGVVVATGLSFTAAAPEAELMVVVDHEPGRVVPGIGAVGTPDVPLALRTTVDGRVDRVELGTGRARTVVTLPLAPGTSEIAVELVDASGSVVVEQGRFVVPAGTRHIVTIADQIDVDVSSGAELFRGSRAACDVCHSVEAGVSLVGPSLAGIADVAETRVPGLSAEGYLRQSILDPDAFVVDGYRAGQMLPIYRERLDDAELNSLVAYLLSLEER